MGGGGGGGGLCWAEAVQGDEGVALETDRAGEVAVRLAGPQD